MTDVAQRLEAIVVATESDGIRRVAGIHGMLAALKNEGFITDFVQGRVEADEHNYEIRVTLPDSKRLAAKFSMDLASLPDDEPKCVDPVPQRFLVTAAVQVVIAAQAADHARHLALELLHPLTPVVNIESCDALGADDHPAVD